MGSILETIFLILTSPLILIIISPFMILKYIRNKYVLSPYLGIIFGLVSFSFVPSLEGQTDLERYLVEIQVFYNNSNLSEVIRRSMTKDEFLVDFLMYISARLGNPHFFPLILMTIFYTLSIYIIIDLGTRYHASSRQILYSLFIYLTLVPYAYVGETIRNATGVLLAFFGVYLYFCKKRNIIYLPIFFILGIGIHTSSLSVIPLFLITFFYRRRNYMAILALILFSTSSEIVITLLSKIFGGINPVITSFFDKGIMYLSAENSEYIAYLQSSAFMKIQRLYFVGIIFFFFLITLYITRKRYYLFSDLNLKLLIFFNLLSSFIIGLSFLKYDLYIRFTMLWILLLTFYFYKVEELFLEGLGYASRRIYTVAIGVIIIGGALHQVLYLMIMVNLIETFERFVFFSSFF